MNPIAPSRIAARTRSLHLLDLVVGGHADRRVVTHDEPAHRAVTDVRADVDADAAVEAGEEIAEGPAPERDAGRERVRRHAFDAAQHRQQPAEVLGRLGASVKPQFPVSRVVTPCHEAGDAVGSQCNCAS